MVARVHVEEILNLKSTASLMFDKRLQIKETFNLRKSTERKSKNTLFVYYLYEQCYELG